MSFETGETVCFTAGHLAYLRELARYTMARQYAEQWLRVKMEPMKVIASGGDVTKTINAEGIVHSNLTMNLEALE